MLKKYTTNQKSCYICTVKFNNTFNMKLYTKAERSTFPYWFAHWKAFNKVAFSLHDWKFKYLFHDIEKPWLLFLWKDYKRVKKWHRDHNKHHLDNPMGKYDWKAMFIDWECSRYTKAEAQLNAYETMLHELDKHKDNPDLCYQLKINMMPLFLKYMPYLPYNVDIYIDDPYGDM